MGFASLITAEGIFEHGVMLPNELVNENTRVLVSYGCRDCSSSGIFIGALTPSQTLEDRRRIAYYTSNKPPLFLTPSKDEETPFNATALETGVNHLDVNFSIFLDLNSDGVIDGSRLKIAFLPIIPYLVE